MVVVYVLKLEGDKYYVGKSTNLDARLKDHFEGGGGCAWTRRHRPVEVVQTIFNCDDFDEDKYTLMFMHRYGVDNVRGGAFVAEHLTQSDRAHLDKQISSAIGRCVACGREGHFANECRYRDRCSRCKRRGHARSRCYARTTIYGEWLGQHSCARCKRRGHSTPECYARTFADGTPIGGGSGDDRARSSSLSAASDSGDTSGDGADHPSAEMAAWSNAAAASSDSRSSCSSDQEETSFVDYARTTCVIQ